MRIKQFVAGIAIIFLLTACQPVETFKEWAGFYPKSVQAVENLYEAVGNDDQAALDEAFLYSMHYMDYEDAVGLPIMKGFQKHLDFVDGEIEDLQIEVIERSRVQTLVARELSANYDDWEMIRLIPKKDLVLILVLQQFDGEYFFTEYAALHSETSLAKDVLREVDEEDEEEE